MTLTWQIIKEQSQVEKITHSLDWNKTTAVKRISRGENKGLWRMWWNPSQGGVWLPDA